MALVLAVKMGESVYLDNTRVSFQSMNHVLSFKVMVHAPGMNNIYHINDKVSTEVLSGIQFQAAIGGKSDKNQVRVAITAPPRIRILRESLWLAQKEKESVKNKGA